MNRFALALGGHVLLALAATMFSAGPAEAAVKTETVEYKAGDTKFVGFLAYDDAATGKRPGVLVAPEWMGLNDYARTRARQLAELGFVAFAMDPYGNGKNAADPTEAAQMAGALKKDTKELRGRATAALETLRKNEHVDTSKLAAIGYCFGGTTVLELARSGADIAGVVSFHGDLDSPRPEDGKNIKCKVLALHGADDPFVPAKDVAAFEEEMRQAKVDWQLVKYGGAVHSFTDWNAGANNLEGAAYNEKADHRSWADMQQFFAEVLK